MSSSTLRLIAGAILLCTAASPAFAKEKPEATLLAARKTTDTHPWIVQAHVNAKKSMQISGMIFGNDFDLTIETLDGITRQITVGEKNWSSEDGGKTWKSIEQADRSFYYLVHTPVKSAIDGKIPPFEDLGVEKVGGDSLLHIRYIDPQEVQFEGDRPNYWIDLTDGKPPLIRRYHGFGVLEKVYVNERVEYAPLTEKDVVLPPPGNPRAAAEPPGPERLLMAAMKKMTSGVWEVNGTSKYKKTLKLHGLLDGEDFDITMDPGAQPDTPMREIMIGDKAWICSDGKSWHTGIPEDRLVYTFTHTPIMHGRLQPAFEKVESEPRDGATWLHIKLKVPDAKVDSKDLPHYWLVLDAHGEAQYIGHADVPVVSRGSNEVNYTSFDYAPSKERIAPPPAELIKATPPPVAAKEESPGAPVDKSVHGFADIEAHKAEWSGKIVRLAVTPMLLQAAEVSNGMYQVMLKDTRPSYGQVEFPGEALVSLGFLKKVIGGKHTWNEFEEQGILGRKEGTPVSFYVRVVNIGERPAARCIAVGSKYSAGSKGKGSYAW